MITLNNCAAKVRLLLVVSKYCLKRVGGYPKILKHGIIGGYPRRKGINIHSLQDVIM